MSLRHKLLVGFFFMFLPVVSNAGPHWLTGKINNLTVTTSGVMVTMDTGLPDNCEGSPSGWMLVEQSHSAITSVVLALWVTGNTTGTIYTTGRLNGSGFCLVNQFDPVN